MEANSSTLSQPIPKRRKKINKYRHRLKPRLLTRPLLFRPLQLMLHLLVVQPAHQCPGHKIMGGSPHPLDNSSSLTLRTRAHSLVQGPVPHPLNLCRGVIPSTQQLLCLKEMVHLCLPLRPREHAPHPPGDQATPTTIRSDITDLIQTRTHHAPCISHTHQPEPTLHNQ